MKKLRLNPEELSVEPFEIAAEVMPDGSVHGNDASSPPHCTRAVDSCGYPHTCGGSSCDTGYPVCYLCTANAC